MRKTILLLCLLAATIVQAQTKEETIDWLNLYSHEFLQCKRPGAKDQYIVKVDVTGNIKVEYRLTNLGNNRLNTQYFTFQAKDITTIYMPASSEGIHCYYITVGTRKDAVKKVFNSNEEEQTS